MSYGRQQTAVVGCAWGRPCSPSGLPYLQEREQLGDALDANREELGRTRRGRVDDAARFGRSHTHDGADDLAATR